MAFSEIQSKAAARGTMEVDTSRSLSTVPAHAGAPAGLFCQALLGIADRWRKLFFAVIAAVYLLAFNGRWRMGPDSGLYLNLARSLALGNGYNYYGVRQETVYPGLPVALAGLWRISGSHFIFAADALILACALASLALVYRLILLACDRPTAVLVAVGLAFNHEFFRFSFEILTDMPFLTGVLAVMTGHEAIFGLRAPGRGRWWDWALLVAGLVIVVSTRPTMIGLLFAWIVALIVCVVSGRNRRAAAIAVVGCLVAAAFFLLLDPRRLPGHSPAGLYEQYAFHQLTHNLPHELGTTAVNNLCDLLKITAPRAIFGMDLLYDWSNMAFAGIALAAGIALIRQRLFWGLWVIITLLTLVLLISNYRYMLPILPLLVVSWWNLLLWINTRLPRRVGNWAFMLLLLLGTMLNIAQVGAFIVHQRARPFLADYQGGEFQPFVQMAREIPGFATDQDVILCPTKLARIMSYLADRTFSEPNEPIVAAPGHLLVILDPTDSEYYRWLAGQGVSPEGDPLASVSRAHNQPAIVLIRARMGAQRN
jgi:hypothetical protein